MWPEQSSPATGIGSPRCAVLLPRPSRASTPRCSRRSRWSTSSRCPSAPSPTGGGNARDNRRGRHRQRPRGDRTIPARVGPARPDLGTALQRCGACVRGALPKPGTAPRGAVRGEGSRHEGAGGGALEIRDARRRGRATGERPAGDRAPPEGRRAGAGTRRDGLAPHAHAHRHDGDGGRARAFGGSGMRPVLTPIEMAASDRAAVEAGTPVEGLMERAGRAVAWCARKVLGGTYGRHVLVVCGKGNNGGDGLVAAQVLRGWGVRVDVMALQEGISAGELARSLDRAALVIDAMYGTGFRGALEGDAAQVAEAFDAGVLAIPVVAVDIPSGVDGATGSCSGAVVRADHTVTFVALKPGLVFEPGRAYAGTVEVVDIGIEPTDDAAPVGVTEAADVRAWVPKRAIDAHKWSAGGVMVVGGSAGMVGAPLLVSRAAMRMGAGIVHCGVPGRDAAGRVGGSEVIAVQLPERDDGALDATAADVVLAELSRFRALVVGPGLGRHSASQEAVRRVVADAEIPLVLDADGLNALQGDLSPLRTRATAGRVTILTPHDGEYGRLMGSVPGPDRIAAARALADASGAVALLKGPTTVVAEPTASGRGACNPTGGPALATAGSGDVLAGMLGALLAGGSGAFEAGAAGAWMHGLAGVRSGNTCIHASDHVDATPTGVR